MRDKQVVIIGAGPAGIAAAIQLKRQSIPFQLLEGNEVGGLLRNANWVENYPGFSLGISGMELVQRFQEHLAQWNIHVQHEAVSTVKWENGLFHIQTNLRSISCPILIVASGTQPKTVSGVRISPEALDHINSDVVSLSNVKNKAIVIIGAGDAAFDYALNLSRNNKITILNRGEKYKCLPLLWDRCNQNPNITYLSSVEVKSIDWENRLLLFYSNGIGMNQSTRTDHVIIAIGREPNLSFLDSSIEKQVNILLDKNKLFLIGDVAGGQHRQAAISVGDGIRVAMEINDLWRFNNS